MLAFFRQLLHSATGSDVDNIVLAMPHRGKLNIMTTILKLPPAKIFHKFRGQFEFPAKTKAMGDVSQHFRELEKQINFF